MSGVIIRPYQSGDEEQIKSLIVGIQRAEFSIPITAEDQPDLSRIREFYQNRNGGFWVALQEQSVIGTVALVDIGESRVALRKMFVSSDYRGQEFGIARELLRTALEWCESRGVTEVFLGTISKFVAARKFYGKNGFEEVDRKDLPVSFPIMAVDDRFFKKVLKK